MEDPKCHAVVVLFETDKPEFFRDIRSGSSAVGACVKLPTVFIPRDPGGSHRPVAKRDQAIVARLHVGYSSQAGNLPTVTGIQMSMCGF